MVVAGSKRLLAWGCSVGKTATRGVMTDQLQCGELNSEVRSNDGRTLDLPHDLPNGDGVKVIEQTVNDERVCGML